MSATEAGGAGPHLGTSLVRRPRSPRIVGDGVKCLWRNVGGVGQLVGARWKVGKVMIAVLVQLEGRVAIFGGVGCVGHGFSFDPHHDGLSLKHPHFFSQVPVGLQINLCPLWFCFPNGFCRPSQHATSLCFTCCASASEVKVMNQLSLPTNSQLRHLGRPSAVKRASTSCTRTENTQKERRRKFSVCECVCVLPLEGCCRGLLSG